MDGAHMERTGVSYALAPGFLAAGVVGLELLERADQHERDVRPARLDLTVSGEEGVGALLATYPPNVENDRPGNVQRLALGPARFLVGPEHLGVDAAVTNLHGLGR